MARLSKLSRSIAGRIAIVTGAASGMGRATAHLFADEGAHVAVTDVTKDGVQSVVEEIQEAGGDAAGWELDVTNSAQAKDVVGQVVTQFGGLGILVNNAGISRVAAIEADGFEEAWQHSFDVNLNGQVHMIRACLPHLLSDGAGRIVNIASTEGVGGTAMASPYTASKHGVIGLTKSLAIELGTRGITVNCICPGPINTGMTAPIPDENKAKFARRRTALKRYGEPEEVAHATLNFVLPASSYMTGATLLVDGGMTIRNQ